jgi:hypothetical protein
MSHQVINEHTRNCRYIVRTVPVHYSSDCASASRVPRTAVRSSLTVGIAQRTGRYVPQLSIEPGEQGEKVICKGAAVRK